VDEIEWLTSTDPQAMLAFLRDSNRVSDRKLRLFAVACVHDLALLDERLVQIEQTSERYADGAADWKQLSAARKLGRRLVREAMQRRGQLRYGAGAVEWVAATAHPSALVAAQRVACLGGSDRLREVFGNPFRPVEIDLVWLTPTIQSLAQAAYDQRILPSGELDVARLGVLADALEEAGADAALVEHFRRPGPHWRGCFALDRLTGRSGFAR
jgi:hypothetical protein